MRGCCRRKGYAYGEHMLPHDARVQELGSGKTRVETLTALGIRPRVLAQHRLEDGINAARLLLPRCWFDAEKCARGLEALRHYRCEWDERRQAFRERPLHDWSSHAADAFRYLAMGLREESRRSGCRRSRMTIGGSCSGGRSSVGATGRSPAVGKRPADSDFPNGCWVRWFGNVGILPIACPIRRIVLDILSR